MPVTASMAPKNLTIIGLSGTKKQANRDIGATGLHNAGPMGLSVPPGDAVLPVSPGNYGTIPGAKLINNAIKTMP